MIFLVAFVSFYSCEVWNLQFGVGFLEFALDLGKNSVSCAFRLESALFCAGTVVDVVYATELPNLNASPEEIPRFKYAFLAFLAAIHGLQYCMPVVTMDRTNLYEKYKGHLLLVVSMNDVGSFKVLPPKRPADEIPRSGRCQHN
ncbi:unnamed protein product [Cuscuta campestris]|uniref:Uncharacterized protein n=1 Tax=Cuscuta campestris TaxID=132261 RepID=A0A484M3I1_9ASTE|nr:unnamed protein product [Cuscuta campestris]